MDNYYIADNLNLLIMFFENLFDVTVNIDIHDDSIREDEVMQKLDSHAEVLGKFNYQKDKIELNDLRNTINIISSVTQKYRIERLLQDNLHFKENREGRVTCRNLIIK